MKFKLLFILLAVFAISCSEDDVNELTEVTQDVTVNKSLTVNLPQGATTTYSITEVFDVSNDIVGIDDKISEVVIESIEMTISNYSAPEVVTLQSLEFSFSGLSTPLAIPAAIDLSTAGNTVYSLDVSTIDLTGLEDVIKSTQVITASISGSVDKVPVNFTANFTIKMKVTGNPI